MRRLLTALPFLLTCLWAPAVLAGERELVIRDTIGRAWSAEPIAWKVELAPGEWRGGAVRVARDGRPIPAQANAIEKHPDGSVKAAEILFVVDALGRDAASTFKLAFDREGPQATDLKVERSDGALVLSSRFVAVKVLNRNTRGGREFSPILGVRTASGAWTGGGRYETTTCRPVCTKTELLEAGPVRLRARVTTTFDNGRTHKLTASLWAGSRSVDLYEEFDVGPDDKYGFKEYRNDRDELCWEWWSWYGDKDGTQETHPNNWILQLSSAGFRPTKVRYRGEASTDSAKGDTRGRGGSSYSLTYDRARRLEKYMGGHDQWRPDAVTWYCASPSEDPKADALGIFSHSARLWRNPNVLPALQGITLRTGANDMRIWSEGHGRKLLVDCPIGLGARAWAIRAGTNDESFRATGTSPTALTAEIVKLNLGLDIVRTWITDWDMSLEYPRLFIKPEDKGAFYARLKGKGIDSPGNALDSFLRNQDQAGYDRDYAWAVAQADRMIDGYWSTGCDNTNGYPGWMLSYWHGISVANGLDVLAGSPLAKPGQVRALKKKLAILTYCLTSKNAWSDKQINYGWGSMNMPVGRWGGLVIMASANSDHPMAEEWLKDAGRYFDMLLETEFAPDGTHISCPHYIGASSTSFYAWIALANSGLAEDVSASPVLQNFARYYMHLMTPVDPRWGIRTLICEGDSRPGSSPFPGILATLFRKSSPELAGQLMRIWIEGGRDVSSGMGVPDSLIIDPGVPVRPLALKSEVFPGFGVFLHERAPGTPEETYLAFLGGDFMIDHTNADQLAFHWHEKGVPLSVFCGSMYEPMTCTSLSHNTISWDVRPGGAKDPGKGQAGNWYHDRNQPYVDLGGVSPTLHWQVGWDKESQKITEMRGRVTAASDALAPEGQGAVLLEGRVTVKALTETPTRPDNYAIAIASQAWPPTTRLAAPFTWTRRLLSVKPPTADGMNYLVIRDDFAGFDERTPHFSYWALGDGVVIHGRRARFRGGLGVDTDMVVLQPAAATLHRGRFVNRQCEGIVGNLHRQKHGTPFEETYTLCRAEGAKGKGFLVVLFPYRQDTEAPVVEEWAGDAGVKITWKDETHSVLLGVREHRIRDRGLRARAEVLVLKTRNGRPTSLTLPVGGRARCPGVRALVGKSFMRPAQ